MKKKYSIIAACMFLGISAQSYAQLSTLCGNQRFHDYVFPSVPTPISDVVYGSNTKMDGTTQVLKLDVFQPVGDVSTNRPLVIIAHGGSFLYNTKTGPDVVPLAQDLARLGYVTASMEYRLGMTNFLVGVDSTDAGAAVMRGVQDGRAAVRFFRKNAREGGNTYGIDTNNIFFAGVSAGGFIALHLAYMDQESEFPNYVDTIVQSGLHGGVEGLSGNPGYSSKVKAIVNVCGALGDTLWMNNGDTPLLSFHGTADGTVPYGYAQITLAGLFPLLKVHGSSTVAMRANHQGIPNCMETWLGQDHVPEVGTTAAELRYYDSTITITRTFLEQFTCGTANNCSYTVTPMLGIDELGMNADYTVYPNPTNTEATVDLSSFAGKAMNIELYDGLGRKVLNVENFKGDKYNFQKNNLSAGMYYMSLLVDGKKFSKKVIFE